METLYPLINNFSFSPSQILTSPIFAFLSPFCRIPQVVWSFKKWLLLSRFSILFPENTARVRWLKFSQFRAFSQESVSSVRHKICWVGWRESHGKLQGQVTYPISHNSLVVELGYQARWCEGRTHKAIEKRATFQPLTGQKIWWVS